MIRDNVPETRKAIAEYINARGIAGMKAPYDFGDAIYISREFRVEADRKSLSVDLSVRTEAGERFENEGAVFRPLAIRATVTSTGTAMTADWALEYAKLFGAVAQLAVDIEREFASPVYECLRAATDVTNSKNASLALSHVELLRKEGVRMNLNSRARYVKTTLPDGSYQVNDMGKTYVVRVYHDGDQPMAEIKRTA